MSIRARTLDLHRSRHERAHHRRPWRAQNLNPLFFASMKHGQSYEFASNRYAKTSKYSLIEIIRIILMIISIIIAILICVAIGCYMMFLHGANINKLIEFSVLMLYSLV